MTMYEAIELYDEAVTKFPKWTHAFASLFLPQAPKLNDLWDNLDEDEKEHEIILMRIAGKKLQFMADALAGKGDD